jgi:heat shock protein HtpX
VLAWILSIVIRFALSRKREYLADAGSVELTKNPDAMISALRKIEGRGELAHANSAVMEMCVDNPRVGFSNVFDTHPPIDARVAAIVQYMGGHDPGPIALPEPSEAPPEGEETQEQSAPAGPWGTEPQPQQGGDKPFLPARPPIEMGGPSPGSDSGPWGPRGN